MKRCKTYLVLLLALIYVGQAAVASASPCRGMPMDAGMVTHVGAASSAVTGGHQMAAHAGHHTGHHASVVDGAAGDCCDGGLCAMSHCHAPPALPSSVAIQTAHAVEAYARHGRPSSPVHPSYSLFKPPISL